MTNTKETLDARYARHLATLARFIAKLSDTHLGKLTWTDDGEFIGFLNTNIAGRFDRKATNSTLKAVFPHMHKEIGSRPEYYVKFEDVAIFWQYDNHDRSYVQISVIDFDCPTFDSYEALLKYNTK